MCGGSLTVFGLRCAMSMMCRRTLRCRGSEEGGEWATLLAPLGLGSGSNNSGRSTCLLHQGTQWKKVLGLFGVILDPLLIGNVLYMWDATLMVDVESSNSELSNQSRNDMYQLNKND